MLSLVRALHFGCFWTYWTSPTVRKSSTLKRSYPLVTCSLASGLGGPAKLLETRPKRDLIYSTTHYLEKPFFPITDLYFDYSWNSLRYLADFLSCISNVPPHSGKNVVTQNVIIFTTLSNINVLLHSNKKEIEMPRKGLVHWAFCIFSFMQWVDSTREFLWKRNSFIPQGLSCANLRIWNLLVDSMIFYSECSLKIIILTHDTEGSWLIVDREAGEIICLVASVHSLCLRQGSIRQYAMGKCRSTGRSVTLQEAHYIFRFWWKAGSTYVVKFA